MTILNRIGYSFIQSNLTLNNTFCDTAWRVLENRKGWNRRVGWSEIGVCVCVGGGGGVAAPGPPSTLQAALVRGSCSNNVNFFRKVGIELTDLGFLAKKSFSPLSYHPEGCLGFQEKLTSSRNYGLFVFHWHPRGRIIVGTSCFLHFFLWFLTCGAT